MDIEVHNDTDFFVDALYELAGTEHISVVLDHDTLGEPISQSRIHWLVSLVLEQGKIPLVGCYNHHKDAYLFLNTETGYFMFIPDQVIRDGTIVTIG